MLLAWINALFDVTERTSARPLRDFSKIDLGVCPGCRGVRAVASVECSACGSVARVAADA